MKKNNKKKETFGEKFFREFFLGSFDDQDFYGVDKKKKRG